MVLKAEVMDAGGAKVFFGTLALIMFVTIVYTCQVDGSPFRAELLTPWMICTLVDFYLQTLLLLCWMWYKETSCTARIAWTFIFCGLGSLGSLGYVVFQFSKLATGQPLHKILLRHPPLSDARLLSGAVS
ncbi:hypothetical protein CYMTET_46931 [Cymbomonas tetramitiformis]|uniref:Uncharacterized protein n=1 Tax=Cymbomonas tetramitiformis TaxID=36881 RepID=A0AAE0EWG8_9CHLO|nr:hypothetical protein CYMTET_46931 [Cymbomonas tetramitiformis]